MITALLLLAVAQDVVLGPTLPPGANRALGEAFIQIEEKLEKGEFAAAKESLRLLPKRKITISWDETGIPKERRAELARARDEALAAWSTGLKGVEFKIGKPADLAFTFVKDLPENEVSSMPAGAVHSFSTGAGDPRLETIIALNRGRPLDPVELPDVHNEVAFAVASYLGLEQSITFGSFSSRSDLVVPTKTRLGAGDLLVLSRIDNAIKELEAAVKDKQKVVPARPSIQINPLKLELPTVGQGEIAKFTVQVTNIGNAPLTLRVQPDCGCLVANAPSQIQAGRSALIEGAVDTSEFVGHLKKKLLFYSNDAEFPAREVALDVQVQPVFRLLIPGNGVVQMSESGAEVEAYLYVNNGSDLKPTTARIDGVPGEVTIEPWTGSLADPELDLPAQNRKGYRLRMKVKPSSVPGRIPATLSVETDSQQFPLIQRGFQLQKGIVALPFQLYMGNLAKEPRRFSFLVSRPETGFKIKSIESDNPFVSAVARAVRGQWEHKVTVLFDGKADFGPLESTLTIHTDDPAQPVLKVPVRGIVQ